MSDYKGKRETIIEGQAVFSTYIASRATNVNALRGVNGSVGGALTLAAGGGDLSVGGTGGDATLYAGNGTIDHSGGDLELYAGSGNGTGNGGDLSIDAGDGGASGTAGTIWIGYGTQADEISIGYFSEFDMDVDGNITLNNLDIDSGTTDHAITMDAVSGVMIESAYHATGTNWWVGMQSAYSHASLTGYSNFFAGDAGSGALYGAAYNNILIGKGAAGSLTSGANNIGIGPGSLGATSGYRNIAIGTNAAASLGQSYDNICVGYQAGQNLSTTTVNSNVLIGNYVADGADTVGAYNVIIGNYACSSTIGSYSTVIGNRAGYGNTGGYNTIIGSYAGYTGDGQLNIFIGYQAGYNETGSNKLYIANSNTATPLIYGDFNSPLVKIWGDFEVSGISPGTGTAEDIIIQAGSGGPGGDANIIQILGGNGAAADTTYGGLGTIIDIDGGDGGAANGSYQGGLAGSINIQGGTGGAGSTAFDGRVGGWAYFLGGTGGDGASGHNAGDGGDTLIRGGAGGSAGGGTAGNGGALDLEGGSGVTGGDVTIEGGNGSTTDGNVILGGSQTTRVQAPIGIQYTMPGSPPSAATANRGLVWVERGGSGVIDSPKISLKDETDGYVWYPLAEGVVGVINYNSAVSQYFYAANQPHVVSHSSDSAVIEKNVTFKAGNTPPSSSNISSIGEATGSAASVVSTATTGMASGDIVAINGTSNYDGIYQVDVIVSTTTFTLGAGTYVSDESSGGSWGRPSTIYIDADTHPGHYEIMFTGSFYLSTADDFTFGIYDSTNSVEFSRCEIPASLWTQAHCRAYKDLTSGGEHRFWVAMSQTNNTNTPGFYYGTLSVKRVSF